jgi:hypothetical protein
MKTTSNKDTRTKETANGRKDLGDNVFWDGPYNNVGGPKGEGSSSGKNGIILNNIKPIYNSTPLARRKC